MFWAEYAMFGAIFIAGSDNIGYRNYPPLGAHSSFEAGRPEHSNQFIGPNLRAIMSRVETIRVKILDPKAKRLLHDLEELNLIEIDRKENGQKVQRRFGAMKGFVTHMAEDFDAPLEDFKNYM